MEETLKPPQGKHEEFSYHNWSERVSLSSVCQQWRQVALQTPAFWAHLPPSASRHFEEMLSRSKQVPFSVRIRGEITEETDGLGDALKSICVGTRLQEFHAYGSEEELECCLSFFPQGPTPILTSLRMQSDAFYATVSRHVFMLPRPNLQRLRIDHCRVPWDAVGSVGD